LEQAHGFAVASKKVSPMGDRAENFRAKAKELEERAQGVIDPTARATLLDVARRWRKMARDVDRYADRGPSIVSPTATEEADQINKTTAPRLLAVPKDPSDPR
jgi:hypothetical protein